MRLTNPSGGHDATLPASRGQLCVDRIDTGAETTTLELSVVPRLRSHSQRPRQWRFAKLRCPTVHKGSPQPLHGAIAKASQPKTTEDHLGDVDARDHHKANCRTELCKQPKAVAVENEPENDRLHDVVGKGHPTDRLRPTQPLATRGGAVDACKGGRADRPALRTPERLFKAHDSPNYRPVLRRLTLTARIVVSRSAVASRAGDDAPAPCDNGSGAPSIARRTATAVGANAKPAGGVNSKP